MLNLVSHTAHVEINLRGAEITSFRSLVTGREYLWQADPVQWAHHAPLLFPIIGRLPSDTYLHEGQAYNLSPHGFANHQKFELLAQDAASCTLQLTSSAASYAVYPFEFVLQIHYELRASILTVGWRVSNPMASRELLFSIGAHPAFGCPLRPEVGERFEDYAIHFDHPVVLHRQLLHHDLRTGLIATIPQEPTMLPLSYSLFTNGALIFNQVDFVCLTLRKADKTGPFVRVQFDEFPYLGLWTKGPGAAFICIEPWQGISSVIDPPQELRNKEGIMVLAPGREYAVSYSVEIG